MAAEFDFGAFSAQVLGSKANLPYPDETEWWLKEEYEFLRSDGISLVLETSKREAADEFSNRFRETLAPEFDYELERLFEGSEEEDPLSEEDDLARFWLFRIPGLGQFEADQNLFDFAYFLRDSLTLRSVEPDLAFTSSYPGGVVPPAQLIGTKAIDRAWSLRNMNVPDAWKFSGQQGKGVLIGHPDTGYADHLDLDPARLQKNLGYDYVDKKANPEDPLNYTGQPGHGTATGSVIMSGGTVIAPPTTGEGGTGPPGKVTGVAPDAELVPVRTAKKVYWILSSKLARAIYRCRCNSCHIVSISMGGRGLRSLRLAVADAVKNELLVVAAAGNNVRLVVYPARYRNCIALAASNIHDSPWNGTSRGKAVDVSAPGEGVWRAIRNKPGQSTAYVGPSSGTSYATANAAGVAALWLGHHGRGNLISGSSLSGLSLQEVFRDALKNTARTPQGWKSNLYGSGIIDVLALLQVSVPTGSAVPTTGQPPDTELSQALDFLTPLPEERGSNLLREALNVDRGSLNTTFDDWGNEILSILFDLDQEGT